MFNLELLYRKGSKENGIVVHESFSSDFIINGQSLLRLLTNAGSDQPDYLGCFARGWEKLNKHSLDQLLLNEPPETESGRSLIYVCPECADIGCGAYGCKIKLVQEKYIWSEFAYENGYEEPELLSEVGPFEIDAEEYKSVVLSAYEL